jgi:bisphosphoglycerate-dependent phosphoglycerate mutase
MTTKTAEQYSTNYFTVKNREYDLDPIKYKIKKITTVRCNNARYNHEDEEIKNKFRELRKEQNKRYYAEKKAKAKSG